MTEASKFSVVPDKSSGSGLVRGRRRMGSLWKRERDGSRGKLRVNTNDRGSIIRIGPWPYDDI